MVTSNFDIQNSPMLKRKMNRKIKKMFRNSVPYIDWPKKKYVYVFESFCGRTSLRQTHAYWSRASSVLGV